MSRSGPTDPGDRFAFTGFGPRLTEFYRGLEADNSRDYWLAHRADYDSQVRGPLELLLGELADEFGEAKVFRPNRDMRFSADKSPYKTSQGAYIGRAEATGYYIEASADGVRIGGGVYHTEAKPLAALRTAIDDDERGGALERLLDELRAEDWLLSGDTLKTAPRGFGRDHPRIALLRHRSLVLTRPVEGALTDADNVRAQVVEGWRDLRPLIGWLVDTFAG